MEDGTSKRAKFIFLGPKFIENMDILQKCNERNTGDGREQNVNVLNLFNIFHVDDNR